MKLFSSILILLIFGLYFVFTSQKQTNTFQSRESKQLLIWSDEFDVDGLPDAQKWSYDIGTACELPCGCGWGNNELQYYTSRKKENARIENGHLIITAIKEKFQQNNYTSARLVSKGNGEWTYGRIEIKAKIPGGRGVWPAIWMLPTNNKYGGWPKSGEIDIMEHVGYLPDSVFATIHTESFNGMIGTQIGGKIFSPSSENQFHVYSIEWNKDEINWYIDDLNYFSYPNDQKGYKSWPFNQKFHLVMNVAVGGHWGGAKGVDSSIWPREMIVDYVRVYSLPEDKL